MLKKILFFVFLTMSPVWAEITVSFNPEEVHLGESTELTIESTQSFQKDMPDLSALTGIFAIGGQKSEPFTQQINGRRIRFYRIVYNLFPRKTGQLSSEGITLRNKALPVASLNVLDPLDKTELPIQIQASVAQDKFFPNETFFYTLKLTDGVGLMSGKMTPPVAENASIQLLDNLDRVYQDYLGEQPVQITERTYAITPLSSGRLTVQPVEIYGKILVKKKSQADLYNQGVLFDGSSRDWREIRLETDPVSVTILQKPDDWTGWWLPATQVSLTAEDTFPDTIKAGDSLNRKIVLKAVGVMGEYLPKISQPQGDNVRVYPSPEERSSIQTPVGDIQGIETMSLILIPGQGGTLKIPAVQVPWFNTTTLKKEVALIPEKIIQVQGEVAPAEVQPTQAVESKKSQRKNRLQKKQVTQNQAQPTDLKQKPAQKTNYLLLIGIGFACLLGISLIGYAIKHRKHKSYLLPIKVDKVAKKKKKPLADLYPF